MSKFTVFVGNLPHGSTESDLFAIFTTQQFVGRIVGVKIRNDPSAERTLEYGFVSFDTEDAAVKAIEAMNGIFYHGRKLKVHWAKESSNATNFVDVSSESQEFAQIHMSFISYKRWPKITEETMVNNFYQYGNVVDVVIKKRKQDMTSQCGYGFVRFELSPAGVHSAKMAVEEMRRKLIGDVIYDCSISHELQQKLFEHPELDEFEPVVDHCDEPKGSEYSSDLTSSPETCSAEYQLDCGRSVSSELTDDTPFYAANLSWSCCSPPIPAPIQQVQPMMAPTMSISMPMMTMQPSMYSCMPMYSSQPCRPQLVSMVPNGMCYGMQGPAPMAIPMHPQQPYGAPYYPAQTVMMSSYVPY